ncbi:MAG: FapA family protein [Oscillospiraceae bacterium]|nr:FapA family protein [Oscillospiraceae bacterium]
MNENNNTEVTEASVEAVDSTAAISISDDRMTAYLTMTAPENGGKELSAEDIHKEIAVSPVKAKLEEEAIETALKQQNYDIPIIIARGVRPLNGIDGIINYRFETGGALTPKKNEKDEMDYKDLGLVQNILSGTPIADITHETEGEEGVDVCGIALKSLPGKPAKYMVGLGTVLNEDGTMISAAVDGNLRWHKDHFTVEEVLNIGEDIGAATGNIDFIGDVNIKGNVFEGFFVKSKKNITISGTTSNATIEAGGNIDIKIGAVKSTLKANGDIKTGFCEGCNLESGGDMISASFVSCEALSKGTITAISGKGVVIGGRLTAFKGMVFNLLGSGAYTKTSLTLGESAVLAKEKKELEEEEAQLTEKTTQYAQLAEQLNATKKKAGGLPPDKEETLKTVIRGRFQMATEIKKIKKRITEIDESFRDNSALFVEIRKTVFPGVSVRIGELRKKVEKEWDRCRVKVDNSGDIVIEPITGRM